MSLVAYGSSGEESDTSDSEEIQNFDVSIKEIRANDQQEDSEKLTFARGGTETIKERGLVLPSPKQTSETSNSTGRKASLSSLLPKPQNVNSQLGREITRGQGLSPDSKPLVSLTTMADDDGDEIIEIEEEYEPIAKRTKKISSSEGDNKPKSVGSLFSLLPTPWQAEHTWQKGADLKKKTNSKQTASLTRGTKQPIKISIPTAPKNDSDEEDDMPAAKKFTPSKEGSGLKSLLPKPKHSITQKVDNPNKPSVKLASRPLIPHTLTKKATTTEKKPQKTAKKNQAEDAISDDEDEPVSFFTFTDKTESLTDVNEETFSSHDTKPSTGINLYEPSLEVTNPSVLPLPQGKVLSTAATSQSSEKHLTAAFPSLPVMEEPSTQTDFESEESLSTGESKTRTYYYEQQSGQTQQYGGYSADDYENYSYEPSSSLVNQPYYSQESETYTYTYPTGTATQAQNPPQETDINLEKLQKLKGKRNRHEEINIIDVNADDQIGNSADMVAKYGTEEITHRPSRKKKDMPTAQQRRKHQITYLAFQAKERELELRQQWSANRQTRRQTQSKYGF